METFYAILFSQYDLDNETYDVGDNHWVTKIDEHIKYETPSKDFLAKAVEVY